MRFVLLGLLVLLGVAAFACTVSKGEVQQAESDIADLPIQVEVTAIQLYEDYESNEISANLKYDGKTLAVSGEVYAFGGGQDQAYYVDLKTGDLLTTVRCHFSDSRLEEVTALTTGAFVTLRGKGDEAKDRDPFTIDVVGCSVLSQE